MRKQQTGPETTPEKSDDKKEPDSGEVIFLLVPIRAMFKADRPRVVQYQRECFADAAQGGSIVFSCAEVMKFDGRGVVGIKLIPNYLRQVNRVLVYREIGYLPEMKEAVALAEELGVPVETREISTTARDRVDRHRSAKPMLAALQSKRLQVVKLRKALNGARGARVLVANNRLNKALDEMDALLSQVASMNLDEVG